MKALYAQNFAATSILQHQESGTTASPSSQLLHFATDMLRVAGQDSVVDRKSTILDEARQYLQKDATTAPGKVLFPTDRGKVEAEPLIEPLVNQFAALTSQPSSINSIFGGSLPIFSTQRKPGTTIWTRVETNEHGSYAKALCQKETEDFGANFKVSNTQQESENGFKVYTYRYCHKAKCLFRARIFSPHGTRFDEPVASHIGYGHNWCGLVKSWQTHLEGTRTERRNIGLHPLLKACIEDIKKNTIDPYRLPLPDEMVNCTIEDKMGDE